MSPVALSRPSHPSRSDDELEHVKTMVACQVRMMMMMMMMCYKPRLVGPHGPGRTRY